MDVRIVAEGGARELRRRGRLFEKMWRHQLLRVKERAESK